MSQHSKIIATILTLSSLRLQEDHAYLIDINNQVELLALEIDEDDQVILFDKVYTDATLDIDDRPSVFMSSDTIISVDDYRSIFALSGEGIDGDVSFNYIKDHGFENGTTHNDFYGEYTVTNMRITNGSKVRDLIKEAIELNISINQTILSNLGEK